MKEVVKYGPKNKVSRRGAGYNHLTLVVRGGQVIAWGFNSLCRGPAASIHSEVNALRALFHHLKNGVRGKRARYEDGFDLINIRFTFDSLRISRPCRRCWLFLSKHLWRFRRVMYTTSEGLIMCMSADEFAADAPDHVSKGHRIGYYKRKMCEAGTCPHDACTC